MGVCADANAKGQDQRGRYGPALKAQVVDVRLMPCRVQGKRHLDMPPLSRLVRPAALSFETSGLPSCPLSR